jgi:hypothetical protein
MPSFYFEQVLQTALNGIDQNVTGPVTATGGSDPDPEFALRRV